MCLVCEGYWYVILNFIAALSEVIPNKYYSYVGLKNYLGSVPFSIFWINFIRLVLLFLYLTSNSFIYRAFQFFYFLLYQICKLFFQAIYSFHISVEFGFLIYVFIDFLFNFLWSEIILNMISCLSLLSTLNS